MNEVYKKRNSNLLQIADQKSKRSNSNRMNEQPPEDHQILLKQGFLSQADLHLQNILSSFFSNVEEEGLSDSMIVDKLAQIQSNKKCISKRHYNSSSSSSEDNSYSRASSKMNKHSNNRYLKIGSPKSNANSTRRQKTNESGKFEKFKSRKSSFSIKEPETLNSAQLLGELKNATQSLSNRRNSLTNKKITTKTSFTQEKHSIPKIVFLPSEEEKDVFMMIPLMNTIKDKQSLRSLRSEIHDNINIKPEGIPNNEPLSIASDRSHKEYHEEKEEEETKLFQTISPLQTVTSFDLQKKEYPFRRLQRRNNAVYDSLSEDEENEIDHALTISPNSAFKMTYDALLVLFTIYSFIYVPFSIAFIHTDTNTLSFFFISNALIDLYYIFDIILSFLTEYYDMEEQLIQDPSAIVSHYLVGWFTVDILAGLPLITAINAFMLVNPDNSFTKSTFLMYSNTDIMFIHLLKFFRLLKGLKIFFDNSFARYMVEHHFHFLTYSRWTRLYITLIVFFIFVHVLSSSFVFLGFAYYPSWIESKGLEVHSLVNVYITSFYFICITVFGIGYGDIVPININERTFSVFLLIVGVMIYSWAVSSISSYSDPKDEKINEYKEKMAVLEHIKLANNQVSKNLNSKIQRFLSYNLEHEQFNSGEILEQLPVKLKNEFIYEMYKSILDNFIFFKSFHNNDFSIKVLLSFKPIVMIKNELVVSEGDYLEEMFFVKRGLLVLELPIPSVITEEYDKTNTLNSIISSKFLAKTNTRIGAFNETQIHLNKNYTKVTLQKSLKQEEKLLSYERQYVKLIEIRKNEHFGDIVMFLNQRCPLRVRIKSTKAELYLLKKTDAIDISMSFPKIWRKIIRKSLFNFEQLNRLVKKTLRFFFLSNQKSLYHLERKFNLVSTPNYNDTNITDLAFKDYNKANDNRSDKMSSDSLATIPSCIDENSSNHKTNGPLPLLTLEDNNENEMKNTENSTSQLIPDKRGSGSPLRINSTKALATSQALNSNRHLSPKKSSIKPTFNLKEVMKQEDTIIRNKDDNKPEAFDDSKSKLSFDFKDPTKSPINRHSSTERSELLNQNIINAEILPGEILYRFEDYDTKSISNLNVEESILSIKKNCTRNFVHFRCQRSFSSKLIPDRINEMEFIIKPIQKVKSQKVNKSQSIKNDFSLPIDAINSVKMPPIQISSAVSSSFRHSAFAPNENKAPAGPVPLLDLNKNILVLPGLQGNKREEGNASPRSNYNDNASFRSIFDSSKRFKTPDLRPRKCNPVCTPKNNSLLQQIGENIHRNSINLNNPSLFYSNAFTDMINKVNDQQQENENDKQINKKLTGILKIIEEDEPS